MIENGEQVNMNKQNQLVKRIVAMAVIALLVMVTIMAAAVAVNRGEGTPYDGLYRKGITVSGEATVQVVPNVITISLGVETVDKTAEDTQRSHVSASNKVMEAIKNVGIDEADICNEGLRMNPNYEWSVKDPQTGRDRITGYTAVSTLSVKVSGTELAGKVIEAAMNSGANRMNGINYSIEDSTEAYVEALEIAFGQANKKAIALAKQSGIKIDVVTEINEEYSQQYIPQVRSNVQVAMDSADYGGSVGAMQLESGVLNITARVSVHFSTK